MDGILNIDKPRGRTSFSIVAMVRRLSGEKKVGHAGTLDPAAGGVLPVCLGQATRVTEYLMDETKVYRAEIELGITTDTDDAEGKVIERRDPSGVSLEMLKSVLPAFTGEISQTPPMFSALKYHGKPLYELARSGITVERESRPIVIYSLEITGWQPPFAALEIVCGKGTYIRSLAYDIGQKLGCGASLKNLVRTRCGVFGIEDSISIEKLEEIFKEGSPAEFLYPLDAVLAHLSAVTVGAETEKDIRNGKPVMLSGVTGQLCRAYAPDGEFLAVLRFDPENGIWHPEKVFRPAGNAYKPE